MRTRFIHRWAATAASRRLPPARLQPGLPSNRVPDRFRTPLPSWLLAVAAAGVVAPGQCQASDWWIQAGPLYRAGMSARVSGSSYTQIEGLHAAPPVPPSDAEGYADRIYDDGYVKIDSGTLDPNAVGGPGFTWNWGYDQADQFDAAAGLLSFHRSIDRVAVPVASGPVDDEDDLDGVGLLFQGGRTLWRGERWVIDLGLGFQGVWGMESRMSATVLREDIGHLTITDRFDVAGAVHPEYGFAPPRTVEGGYAGTYDGPAAGASTWIGGYPAIPNVPESQGQAVSLFANASSQVRLELDEDYYELTVSPRFGYQVSKRVTAYLVPKVGVGLAAVDAQRSESFREQGADGSSRTLGEWNDKANETEAVFTCGLSAGVNVDLGAGFYVGALGGYDWVVDPMRFDLGPNQVTLDNSGWSVGLTLEKTF